MTPGWLSAIAAAVSATAVLAAGSFAYVRFIRARVHHADLSIEISASITKVEGHVFLHVRLGLRNAGTLKIHVGDFGREVLIKISTMDRLMLDEALRRRKVLWDAATPIRVNPMHEDALPFRRFELEPGERTSQSLLVPVDDGAGLAYKVGVTATGDIFAVRPRNRKQTWSTDVIVLTDGVRPTPEKVD